MRWWQTLAAWKGWRLLVPLAVCLVIAVVFYTGFTIHQHNSDLDCMKQGFNQVLNELLHHHQITAPPDC